MHTTNSAPPTNYVLLGVIWHAMGEFSDEAD